MTLDELVDAALAEDVGAGDVTAEATVDAAARGRATITQKAPGVISGLGVAEAVFRRLDPDAAIERLGPEGEWREAGAGVLRVEGSARALLTAERTALNFLGRLSGVATLTATRRARDPRRRRRGEAARHAQDHAGPARAREARRSPTAAASTTAPGSTTSSSSRRTTRRSPGGVGEAVRRAREARPDLPLAVEVRDPAEIDEALAAGAPRLLLDNMSPDEIRAAVAQVAGRAELEASGGIDPETVLVYATISGLHYVSMGALTHSAPALDLSLILETLPMTLLTLENIPQMQAEVRALANERGAVILAHNYQVPEVQEVADFVGDSLGLSQQAAATDAETIVFCGVHFMAETASILSPEKTVLLPDPDAGCSLADSITAPQLRAWKAKHPGAIVVMYVNTTAEVKAETDYCVTSANAVAVVDHIYREHGDDTEILFGPDMFLGAYVEKTLGRTMHVWDGECHVHAGIRPRDITAMRDAHPGADFLIHPECGCSTSVMEYVAAGDVAAEGVHMLSTGGMLGYARDAAPGSTAIVATETGMLHPLRELRPDVDFVAANEAASCRYMKMITLPEAARHAADDVAAGQGARGDRRARPAADRADGRDQLACAAWLARRGVEQLGPVRPEVHEVLVADAEASPARRCRARR